MNNLRTLALTSLLSLSFMASGLADTTTNYSLYQPAIDEEDWGDLVNANWDTIDLTMKSIDDGHQPLDSDLTYLASFTPTANVKAILNAASYAAIRTLLDLEAGTDFYSISAADAAFEAELNNSAGLASALSDETGSGSAVFSTSPSLTTPSIAGATVTGSLDLTGALTQLDYGTTLVSGDCDSNSEFGRLFIKTNEASGEWFHYCEGTAGWKQITSAATTALDDVGNPDANSSITLAGYTLDFTSTLNAADTLLSLSNTVADLTSEVVMFGIDLTDDGDADGIPIRIRDNSAGDTIFEVGADGAVTGGVGTFDQLVVSDTSAGSMTLSENTSNGTEGTTIQSLDSMAADVTYTLPPDDGDAGEQLQTDGSGVLTWEAAGGGGATAMLEVVLPVQSAKRTGSFVTDGDATQGAQIDGGDGNWRLLFDATTDEAAVWQFRMPNNYSSDPLLKVGYSMASATTNEVEFEGAIMCVSDGDAADIGTASFSTIAVASATVPGTAGHPDAVSITLTDDSCAAGDMVWIYLSTDSDDATNDDATGDREVVNVSMAYTGS